MSMQDTILPHASGWSTAVSGVAARLEIIRMGMTAHNLEWYKNPGPAQTTRR